MDLSDQELITEFVVESREGLSAVETQMLAIEACGADINTDLVNAVFRTMHSIKGSAGFLGLDRIGELAHSLEEVLNSLRNREIVPTSELISAVLSASDTISSMIESIESSNDFDVTEHVERLQQIRSGVSPEPVHTQAVEKPQAPAPQPVPQPAPQPAAEASPSVAETVDHGAYAEFLAECHENLDQMEQDLLALEQDPTRKTLLRRVFRTMHMIRGGANFLGLARLERLTDVIEDLISDLRDDSKELEKRHIHALQQSARKCREGLGLVGQSGSDEGLDAEALLEQLWQLHDHDGPVPGSPADSATPARTSAPAPAPAAAAAAAAKPAKDSPAPISKPAAPAPAEPATTAASRPASESKSANREAAATTEGDRQLPSAADTTIRVDVALLDKLMTRVGELVLARNQILQHTSAIQDANFISTAQRLNLITTELQEGVMKTRMQPIGNVWAKFPRVVRDLASLMGKQVRIEMEGKETELDKTIVEAIKDPLTHLIRNSVDHGIEAPDKRLAAGKPAEGVLRLRAFHEGGQVNIEIIDDGAGLNIDRIRAKAVERGLMSPDQVAKLSDREATQLIMLPGFSTAQQVTSVSGRGVGMDVVKTNIERIGGMIDLHSRPGKGTTVKIKIPLTLAIIPALIVTNRGDRYAIPQVSLLELVRLEGQQIDREIEFVHGAPVYRLRGKLLPLVSLSEQLDGVLPEVTFGKVSESADQDRVLNIVVLRAQNQQFGLVVDRVNDTEEIVVKPLSRQLNSLGEYAGATIMGDGTVALILDVMGLAVSSGLAGEIREQALATTGSVESTAAAANTSVLIVDLGDTRRFAFPTSVVSRLEKAALSEIEYADGAEVLQYRGDILPLVRLCDVFGCPAMPVDSDDELQIVVYSDQERSFGLVVNRIVDVVDVDLQYRTYADPSSNLIGTAIIQNRVTDVLNLHNLAIHATRSRFAMGR